MAKNGIKTAALPPGAVAVIGMSGRFPGAGSLEEFWGNLIQGRETISFFTRKELEKDGEDPFLLGHPDYIRAKGILEGVEDFDAGFFGYPPREAEKMDPQLRLLHECAWEALESAGHTPESDDGRIGIFLGAGGNQEWQRRVHSQEAATPGEIDGFLLNDRDYAATRIAHALDLKGPCFTLLSACSTSLVAVHLASQAIRAGECGLALAGGASLSLPRKRGYLYQEGLMVSRTGHCRAFDSRADGTVFGDGVGVVLLKRAERALADRDPIRAVILGSAVNNDGNGKGAFTAPSSSGQEACIRAALAAAGIDSGTIGYIEAHGTGTRLGDPVELKALNNAFRDRGNGTCWLGSVKSNIGHVNVAAGVSALIKTVLILENRRIPPSLHFRKSNPDFPLQNSPFRVPTRTVEWQNGERARRAGVSAFGFGGTNAHIILEEAPRRRGGGNNRSWQLLPLSALSPEALQQSAERLADNLEKNPETDPADTAFTLSAGRRAFPWRRTILCRDTREAVDFLRRPDAAREANQKQGKTVFLFPGQSAQYCGMARELHRTEPAFRAALETCREILRENLGLDLLRWLYPEEGDRDEAVKRLRETTLAQPAIFSVSYAMVKLLEEWGIRPSACLGHSIGELTAACVAGVFTLEQALRIVARRGEFMQGLPRGAMLAVPLAEEEIQILLGPGIDLAAVNAPSLCVLSGPKASLERLRRRLREQGTASRWLHTSHAFHSAMMEPIMEPFAQLMEGCRRRSPRIPLLSTVTGDWIRNDEVTQTRYWMDNLRLPVRFSDAARRLLKENDDSLIEVGPGRTLSNLIRMIPDRTPERAVVPTIRGEAENRNDTEFLLSGLGRLWQAGVEIDWPGFYRRRKRRRIPLPTYPFQRQRFWLDPDGPRENALHRLDRLGKLTDMSDWFAVPSWKRTPPPQTGTTGSGTWLIFSDGVGLGGFLAAELRRRRRGVVTVRPGAGFAKAGPADFTIGPDRKEDYDRLFEWLAENDRLPRRILHLWNVSGDRPVSLEPGAADAAPEAGFFSLLLLAQKVEAHNPPGEIRLLVVSDHLHEVTGGEVLDPIKAPALGPVKVIPQEYPNIRCGNLDFREVGGPDDPIPESARRTLDEALSKENDRIVAWRRGFRWVQEYQDLELDRSYQKSGFLREEGVYLITGGLGGIGLVLAQSLARAARAKLILTGRTRLPARGRWKKWLGDHGAQDPISRKIRALLAVEDHGGEFSLIRADVADPAAMREGLARAERSFGPVNGVVHAAGVPGEGILQLKSVETARRILSPKVQGTLVLMEILRDRDLDFVVLCSSIAAVLGGIGLGDYCAANNFLDAYAAARRRHGHGPVVSVNWDMWGEVGMGLKTEMPDELKDWFRKELQGGLTSREGVAALQRVLTWGRGGNVVVSTRDLQTRFDLWIRGQFMREKESLLEDKADKPRYTRPSLSTTYDQPRTATEKTVAKVWEGLFGIEKVGRRDNFYELGGHSLLATTLLNRLRRECGAGISIRDVLDHPTVEELAALIDRTGPA